MQKILIPLFACLLMSAQLFAQVPKNISVPFPVKPATNPQPNVEAICNNAGTFTFGQFIGQSNDPALPTIFLCLGDSIFVNHNGDFDLSGDPVPITPAGIGYAFYVCPPTVIGDDLQTVLTDPCLLPGAANGIWVTDGTANGDTWFFNSGALQTAFNSGQPIGLYFAPITLDNFATEGFEGTPQPGPCVNVNAQDAFQVVYLNAIAATGIDNNFGDDCLGKFRIRGGYPEWDNTATYTISIALSTDPSVKALIHTQESQLFHAADVIFSVSQAGLYTITVEDGKSCGFSFQMDMNTCAPTDNIIADLPDVVSPPGSTICVPLTVQNFNDIVAASFSVQWNEALLTYTGVQGANPGLGGLNASNLNETLTQDGQLGVLLYNAANPGAVLNIGNGDTLFNICFAVVGPLGSCSPLTILNNPTAVGFENELGEQLAVTVDTGSVCIDFLPLSVNVSIIDPTCNGTASLQVTASGGTEPYDIVWNLVTGGPTNLDVIPTSGGTFTQAGLTNGTYSVCVRDDNGIGTEICDTVVVNVQQLGAALNLTQLPSCNGLNDGSVSVNVFLGATIVPNPTSPEYQFNWAGSNVVQNVTQQTGLIAGNYSVTVTQQATGCSATASGTLGQPAPISEDVVNVTPASCNGVCDGAIAYTAEGGTPFPGGAYNYNWEYAPAVSNPTVQDDNVLAAVFNGTNKCAGFYFLTVTDANGCTFTDEVSVTNARTLQVEVLSAFDPSCNGLSDGSITVELNAEPPFANPSFAFFWAPSGFPQVDNGNSSTYSGLSAQSYNVVAIETVTGCLDTASIVLNNPPVLDLTALSVQNPSCLQQNDGAISVVATGGTGVNTYDFLWNIPGVNPSQNFLSPGAYSVTVTDANGCQDSLSFNLALPTPPAITAIDSVSVKCGSDGSLTVVAPTAVSFTWTNSAGTTVGNTATVNNLPGDTYTVVISDNQSCTNTATVVLESVVPLAFLNNTTYTQPTCFGYCDGSVSVGVEGGTPSYAFNWSNGQTSPTAFNICAGVQSLTVTDGQGCVLTDTFVLLQPPSIGAQQNFITPASCFSTCDGGVTLVAFYNTVPPTQGNFSFAWSDGQSTSAIRNDLCAGVYTVTIIDGNNCFREETVTIGSPTAVTTSSVNTTDPTCFNGANGAAAVTPTGGNGLPYTFNWNTTPPKTTASVTGLAAGTYIVTITDNSGCTGTATVIINNPDPIVVTLEDQSNPTCFGLSDGLLTVSASGGGGAPYTYVWSDGTTNIGTGPEQITLTAGLYSVTATDPNGCTGSLINLGLTDPPPVIGELNSYEPIECFGGTTILSIDTIYGGAGPDYSFSFDNGPRIDPNNTISLTGGIHTVTYFDGADCFITDTIDVPEPPEVKVIFPEPILEVELGDSIQLFPNIPGVNIDTFIWTPANRLNDPTSLTPWVLTYFDTVVTLVVFDQNGCSGSASVTINVDPNRNVYIPNAFRPNNTININDHFVPSIGRGVDIINYMRVFDRWGNLMYEQNDFKPTDTFTDGWDGRYKNKYVNPGVYVYVIEVKFLDGRVLLYRGDVTVVR